jgi:hypothetical protein
MQHGDDLNCGFKYAVDGQTYRAVCMGCNQSLEYNTGRFPNGAIVRLKADALKAIYGKGGKGAPIDGMVVGADGGFPIVYWSDSAVGTVSPANLELAPKG